MDQDLFLSIEEKSQQTSCVLVIYICQAVNLYQVDELFLCTFIQILVIRDGIYGKPIYRIIVQETGTTRPKDLRECSLFP